MLRFAPGGPTIASSQTPPASPFSRVPPLRSFAYRDFRFLWASSLLWSVTNAMLRIGVLWSVLELTGSPFLVALAYALEDAPMLLLGPVSGVVADRVSRKLLLLAVLGLSSAVGLALAVLAAADLLEVWALMAGIAIFGAGSAFCMTGFQTLIYDVVGPGTALNGLSLWSIGIRSVSALAAIGGGVLIEVSGVGAAFVAASASSAAAVAVMAAMRYRATPPPRRTESVVSNLMGGFEVTLRSSALVGVLALALAAELFGYGMQSLLPVFASDRVFSVGATGLGIMSAAFGLGGVLSGVALASAPNLRRKGAVLIAVIVLASLFVGGFSQSPLFAVSVVLLVAAGMSLGTYDTLAVILLQENVPNEMRGRAVGSLLLTFGIGPVGPLMMGYLAEGIGVQSTVGIGAAMMLAATVAITVALPRLRALP